MATTYTWIGTPGTAAFGDTTTDWSPNGIPGPGDTGILTNGGTILLSNSQLNSNTLKLGNGLLVFAGDTSDTFGAPTFDSLTLLTTNTGGSVAQSSTIDATGNFVNAGTILADGAAGSSLTINIGTTVINGTTVAGYFYNPSVIQADAGNTLTIAVGPGAEVFNTGYIVADGGKVRITVDPSAISGGEASVRGFELIEGGGTLETAAYFPASDGNNGTKTNEEFADLTPGNTLKIDNIGSYGGVIIGFAAGDTIDLGTLLAVGTLTYSTTTSLLGLEAVNGTTLATLLLGNIGTGIASGSFAVVSGIADGLTLSAGADGDTVLTTARTLEASSNTSGSWQSGASWASGVVPGTTASPSIGFGATAPFTLTTGSTPVSVGGFGVLSPFATVQFTSNTTLTTGQVSDYLGTVDITAGNTLTAAAIQMYDPSSSVTIAAGATAELAGRVNTDLGPQNGVWNLQPGQNPFAFSDSAGTAVVDGALLAGPTATARGGDISIGYEGAGQTATMIVNPGAVVTDTHTTMGSDPTSAGTLTINGATWTNVIDVQDTFNSRGNILVGYDNVALNTPAGLPPPQQIAPAVLTIENNAVVTEQRTGDIAGTEDSAGEVTVETGAVWNIGTPGTGSGIGVGDAGSGTLSVLNGGSVAIYGGGTFFSNGTTFTSAGGIGVGQTAGASGTVIVSGTNPATGAPSELSSVNGMAIGKSGQALLSITNGGTVLISGNGIGVGDTAAAGASATIDVGGSARRGAGFPGGLRLGGRCLRHDHRRARSRHAECRGQRHHHARRHRRYRGRAEFWRHRDHQCRWYQPQRGDRFRVVRHDRG